MMVSRSATWFTASRRTAQRQNGEVPFGCDERGVQHQSAAGFTLLAAGWSTNNRTEIYRATNGTSAFTFGVSFSG